MSSGMYVSATEPTCDWESPFPTYVSELMFLPENYIEVSTAS